MSKLIFNEYVFGGVIFIMTIFIAVYMSVAMLGRISVVLFSAGITLAIAVLIVFRIIYKIKT